MGLLCLTFIHSKYKRSIWFCDQAPVMLGAWKLWELLPHRPSAVPWLLAEWCLGSSTGYCGLASVAHERCSGVPSPPLGLQSTLYPQEQAESSSQSEASGEWPEEKTSGKFLIQKIIQLTINFYLYVYVFSYMYLVDLLKRVLVSSNKQCDALHSLLNEYTKRS